MIDAAAAALDVNQSMKCLSILKEVDDIIKEEEESNYINFVVSDEERARVECLKGQVSDFL